ncbi:MAG: hypothetical protein O2U61_04405 [Candidatus Bathyarchaeota archaeon]|nr:hypothetical protein [Candidatus Bathyarchaeota archaeon]MCZ2845725.1 hypothetical protein [Candidatus Bathyarchaeota archaeon]
MTLYFKKFNQDSMIRIITLLLISMLVFYGSSENVVAHIPNMLEIKNLSKDSMGKIELKISHMDAEITDCDCSSHYVDTIEVEIGGQIKEFNIKRGPQLIDPFIIELNLGEIQDISTIKVRAHCNTHGWSGWTKRTFNSNKLSYIMQISAAIILLTIIGLFITIKRMRTKRVRVMKKQKKKLKNKKGKFK